MARDSDTAQRVAVKNAADPEQVKRAGDRDRRRREVELADLRAVMGSVEGRRFVWRLLEHGRIFTDRFDENSLRMARNEGRAHTGLILLADIDVACPELFDTMRREYLDRSNKDD